VSIESGYAIDAQALDIVYPKQSFGRIQVRQAAYPYFIQSTRDQFTEPDHVALSGLNSLTLLWPSPLSVADTLPEGVTSEVLLRTSERGDIDSNGDLSPSVVLREENRGSVPLVVTLEGSFTSAFASSQGSGDAPASPPSEGPETPKSLQAELSETGRTLKKALEGAKIAVIGSSEMVSDLGLGVGNYYSGMFGLRGDYGSGVLMIQNLIEWAVEDDSLASIRTGGPSSRVLRSMSREEQNMMEMMNYGLAIIALIILSLLLTVPRRMASMK
jgi:ABC-2 type transport system permease protein